MACCNDCEVGAAYADAKEVLGDPLGSEKAADGLMKHKITAVFVLISSIAFTLGDQYTDIITCAKWLGRSHSWYQAIGLASLCLLIASTLLSAIINLALDSCYSDTTQPLFSRYKFMNAFIGLFLSLTQLRLPMIAFLQIRNLVCTESGAIDWSAFYEDEGTGLLDFTNPMVVVMLMKMLELTFETLPQLLLQSFVVWIDILDPDMDVPLYLTISISFSFLTLAFGMSSCALRKEMLPTKVLAALYFASGLVMRVGALIGVTILTIYTDWPIYVSYWLLRYLHAVYLNYRSSKRMRTKRVGWCVTAMFQFWLPIGIISFVGDHAPFTVNSVLLTRRCVFNTGMILVESVVCWVLLLIPLRDMYRDDDEFDDRFDDDDFTTNLRALHERGMVYFYRYFVLPLCFMVAFFFLTVASAVKFQSAQFGRRPGKVHSYSSRDSDKPDGKPDREPDPAWLFRKMAWLLGTEPKHCEENEEPTEPKDLEPTSTAGSSPLSPREASSPVTEQPAPTDLPVAVQDDAGVAEEPAPRPSSKRQGSSWLFKY